MSGLDFDALWSKDRAVQHTEFQRALLVTNERVEWSYDAWDELVAHLRSPENHDRAIAAQILCRLSASDPKLRVLRDFDRLFAVTRDERFVTARHTIQALWRIGVVGPKQRARLLAALAGRFAECIVEKNCTLIRYDIAEGLRKLYDAIGENNVKEFALRLIDTEDDVEYKKKYMTLWRGV